MEANKQNAADVLNKTIAELKAPVVVEVLHTRYPQGAEKQLCQAISGRQVPSGKLPCRRRLLHFQPEHHLLHLQGRLHRYARGEQDRHRLRLRRHRAQEH